jgi:hypothetical protein
MPRPPLPRAGIVAALAAAATIIGALPAALGQSRSFSIAWDAPAGCPDEAYVRASVEQLLAGGGPVPAHVDARARVERGAGEQWRVRLTTVREGATGERVVESGSCRSLADATALIVALTIDPERVAARQASALPDGSTTDTGPNGAAPQPVASCMHGASRATARTCPPRPNSSRTLRPRAGTFSSWREA